MGYEVYITRAKFWVDNQGLEIPATEWLEVIKNDPELIPMPENGEYFVLWKGSTVYKETWFDWSEGNIFTKAPDETTMHKLISIAELLNARVQGEEGEFYDQKTLKSEDLLIHNLVSEKNQPKQKPRRIFISCFYIALATSVILLFLMVVFIVVVLLLQ